MFNIGYVGEIINRNNIYLLLVASVNKTDRVQACIKSTFCILPTRVAVLHLLQRVTYQRSLIIIDFLRVVKQPTNIHHAENT